MKWYMKLLIAIAKTILPSIALILIIALPFAVPMLVAYILGEIAMLSPVMAWIFNPVTIVVIVVIVTFAPFVAIEYFSEP